MNVWSLTLAVVAALLLVVIPVWGARNFNPTRARNVKYVERLDLATSQHVQVVKLSHPEIVRVARLDRYPFYVMTHFAVMAYACSVLAGSELTSNVVALSAETRHAMAAGFLIGSVLVLTGAMLGARVGSFTFGVRVREHLTAEVLGDDVALPYRLSTAGMCTVTVSLSIYSYTSFQSTAGSLGGWLTGSLAAAAVMSVVQFQRAVRTFERSESVLISEAQARVEIGEHCDDDDTG